LRFQHFLWIHQYLLRKKKEIRKTDSPKLKQEDPQLPPPQPTKKEIPPVVSNPFSDSNPFVIPSNPFALPTVKQSSWVNFGGFVPQPIQNQPVPKEEKPKPSDFSDLVQMIKVMKPTNVELERKRKEEEKKEEERQKEEKRKKRDEEQRIQELDRVRREAELKMNEEKKKKEEEEKLKREIERKKKEVEERLKKEQEKRQQEELQKKREEKRK